MPLMRVGVLKRPFYFDPSRITEARPNFINSALGRGKILEFWEGGTAGYHGHLYPGRRALLAYLNLYMIPKEYIQLLCRGDFSIHICSTSARRFMCICIVEYPGSSEWYRP